MSKKMALFIGIIVAIIGTVVGISVWLVSQGGTTNYTETILLMAFGGACLIICINEYFGMSCESFED